MASTLQAGYSQTNTVLYHIHLLTHQEELLFGNVADNVTQLNPSGRIAADEWKQIAASHHRDIELDLWIVLPNGLRALIAVINSDSQLSAGHSWRHSSLKPRALSSFVAGFKTAAAKRINLVRGEPGAPVWQRGYQEQRIDDPQTLARIRQLLTDQASTTDFFTRQSTPSS